MGEGYTLALSPEEHPVRNSSLLRGVTNFTYEGLRPGTLYTFEVSTVAGPYTSSARRITNWTRECHSPHRSRPRASHWILCLGACDSTGPPAASCNKSTKGSGGKQRGLTLVCIPITQRKGQQSPVPASSSLGPPSCGTAQAASALNHLSTTLAQTIPPTTSSSTRAAPPSPCQFELRAGPGPAKLVCGCQQG